MRTALRGRRVGLVAPALLAVVVGIPQQDLAVVVHRLRVVRAGGGDRPSQPVGNDGKAERDRTEVVAGDPIEKVASGASECERDGVAADGDARDVTRLAGSKGSEPDEIGDERRRRRGLELRRQGALEREADGARRHRLVGRWVIEGAVRAVRRRREAEAGANAEGVRASVG